MVPGAGIEPATRGFSIRAQSNKNKHVAKKPPPKNDINFNELATGQKPKTDLDQFFEWFGDRDFLDLALAALDQKNDRSTRWAILRQLESRFDIRPGYTNAHIRAEVLRLIALDVLPQPFSGDLDDGDE